MVEYSIVFVCILYTSCTIQYSTVCRNVAWYSTVKVPKGANSKLFSSILNFAKIVAGSILLPGCERTFKTDADSLLKAN